MIKRGCACVSVLVRAHVHTHTCLVGGDKEGGEEMAGDETSRFLSSYLAGDRSSIRLWILWPAVLEFAQPYFGNLLPSTTGSIQPVSGSLVYFLGSALLEGLRCSHSFLQPRIHSSVRKGG